VFDRALTVNGLKLVVAGAVGGQLAVPDEWAKKTARTFELITDPNGAGINTTHQRNFIKTLRGDAGTYHAGLPTVQRVAYNGGSTYTPNWLQDVNVASYAGLQAFNDSVAQKDMVWYKNINGNNPPTQRRDIEEIFEHVFHTIHAFGIPGAVPGSIDAVEMNPDIRINNEPSFDWQNTAIHLAMKEVIDAGLYDPSGYAPDWNTDPEKAAVAYTEYTYLVNWSMWDMSVYWNGGSLAPEWSDSLKTPAGMLANNPLGYALFNTYFAPVLSKPDFATIESIFGENDTGVSGYVVDELVGGTPEVAAIPEVPGSSATNVNAITNSIAGDGVTDIVYVQDLGIELLDGDLFVVRKTTSDGSVEPDATSYDTALSGGDLAYTSARGIAAEEIIVDGDGFVTPTTSGGPEELVPGQVLDTLDIKVYTRDSEGQGVINSQSYIMDSTLTYNLGVTPNSSDAVIVKVANVILPQTDYTINWVANTITLNTAVIGAELNILTVSNGGQNILDFGQLIADGSTAVYETTVDWTENASVYASVNGIQAIIDVFASETTSKTAIRFAEVLEEGAVINYTVFSDNTLINYSQITKDVFTGDGVNNTFTLANAPLYAVPLENNVLVKINNKILNAGYNIQYTIPENNQREYPLEIFQIPAGSLDVADVKVFLNGAEIVTPLQWRFEIANSSITLADEIGSPGDLLEMYVITDGEYRINGDTITLDVAPANNAVVEIIQFTNHNLLGIERINYEVVSRTALIPEDIDYITYRRLTVGEVTLRQPAVDAQYVWVSVNRELLSPSVDYYVTDDRLKVRLVKQPTADDVIDIIHFTAPVSKPKFAYRQFKDMLNRTHFKRLEVAAAKLAQPLNYYDLRIELDDASSLSEPNKGQNLPGVVFIEGERIEYFVKEDNTLRQLRRGTLGTGVKDTYAADTNVYDQNISKTVPYKDQTLAYNATADGITATFEIGYPVASINEIEVFAAGTRLRKAPLAVFNPAIALDSPEGDATVAADFTFDAATNEITLLATPAKDTRVTVVKKVGQSWTTQGTSLGDTENSIARFLRAGTSALPE
jgi:hypothetical protein